MLARVYHHGDVVGGGSWGRADVGRRRAEGLSHCECVKKKLPRVSTFFLFASCMHISVPTSEELVDGRTGKVYVSYNIHVNGVPHCAARYSALLALHTSLVSQFGEHALEGK